MHWLLCAVYRTEDSAACINTPKQCYVQCKRGMMISEATINNCINTSLSYKCANKYPHTNHYATALSMQVTMKPLILRWPTVAIIVKAIKHPVPDRVKPSFVIFDIRSLSVRVPRRQKLQMTA